jgi:hypothetical protein
MVGAEGEFTAAAETVWPEAAIITMARPANLAPVTVALCLFIGKEARFACKICLLPSVSEVMPISCVQYSFPCRRLMLGRAAAGKVDRLGLRRGIGSLAKW